MKIFVGNLNFKTTENQLQEFFSEYGDIDSVKIITDRESGRSRGFGFVEISDDEAAQEAIEALNESELQGRQIIVNKARPKRNDSRGGGFKRNRY